MGLKTRLASIGSKLKTFFVTVFEDYKAVASDTAADMRKKPIRGAMKVGTVALIIQAVRVLSCSCFNFA